MTVPDQYVFTRPASVADAFANRSVKARLADGKELVQYADGRWWLEWQNAWCQASRQVNFEVVPILMRRAAIEQEQSAS